MKAQHPGNTGAIEIDVQEPDSRVLTGQGEGKVDGRHALSDAALAAHDDQFMLDAGHASLHLLHLISDLRNDFGVVGILEFTEDGFEIFFYGHKMPSLQKKTIRVVR
jgi:hypothetical protein